MSVFGPYPATVIKVHDGDTCTLIIDLGFGITYTINCRLYGINAPELNTDAGKASRAHLTQLLPTGPNGVTVLSYGWDKYGGRFDGVIWPPKPSAGVVSYNRQMLTDGFAVQLGEGP